MGRSVISHYKKEHKMRLITFLLLVLLALPSFGKTVYITGFINDLTYQKLIHDIDNTKLTEGDTLEVVINSAGGYVHSGLAMYGLLSSLKPKTTVITIGNGLCASAATIVLQAGDTRLVSPYTLYMVHFAHNDGLNKSLNRNFIWRWWYRDKIAKDILELEYVNKLMVNLYCTRTKRSWKDIRRDLSFDNYLRADQFIQLGYADGYSSWSKR